MATVINEKIETSVSIVDRELDYGINKDYLKQLNVAKLSDKCTALPDLEEVLQFFVTAEIGLAYATPAALGGAETHIKRLCEYKLLSPEMERKYFEQLAYCLHYGKILHENSGSARELALLGDQYESLLEILTRSNTRMILSIIKPFVRQGWDFDELVSLGTESLLQSVLSFDVFLGYRFSTYFHTVFRRRVYRYMDLENTRNNRFVRYEHFDSHEAGSSSKADDPDLVCDAIDNLLDFLDEREAYIIVRRFGICRQVKHSLKKIADLMDISKERVRQLEQRALNKLRARAVSTGLQDELLLEFA